MKKQLKNKKEKIEANTSSFLKIRTLISFVILLILINAGITAGIPGIIVEKEEKALVLDLC